MAAGVPARLTPAQGRRFGATVGGAFLLLGAVAAWRGNRGAMTVLMGVGAALLGAGLVIPTHLGPVERAWMALAHAISKVTTPIVMGVMYLVVLTPAGVIRRMAGGNPLAHRAERDSFWKARPAGPADPARLKRQF